MQHNAPHQRRGSAASDCKRLLEDSLFFNQSIEKDAKRIVLDMNEVDYVSSAGLRVLLQGAKSLKKTDGEIVLFGMNSAVNQVFKLSGFDSIFRSFDSESKAVS